jgi:hypothetical protein
MRRSVPGPPIRSRLPKATSLESAWWRIGPGSAALRGWVGGTDCCRCPRRGRKDAPMATEPTSRPSLTPFAASSADARGLLSLRRGPARRKSSSSLLAPAIGLLVLAASCGGNTIVPSAADSSVADAYVSACPPWVAVLQGVTCDSPGQQCGGTAAGFGGPGSTGGISCLCTCRAGSWDCAPDPLEQEPCADAWCRGEPPATPGPLNCQVACHACPPIALPDGGYISPKNGADSSPGADAAVDDASRKQAEGVCSFQNGATRCPAGYVCECTEAHCVEVCNCPQRPMALTGAEPCGVLYCGARCYCADPATSLCACAQPQPP